MSRTLRHRRRRARRATASSSTTSGSRDESSETTRPLGCDQGRQSPRRRVHACACRSRRSSDRATRVPSWPCHLFLRQRMRSGTHRRAGGQDSDGASAQAPLRSRTLVRCVHNRTSHTRPTDHLQDTSREGRPIHRSDRVSETLAAAYQHQQRGRCILTADTAHVAFPAPLRDGERLGEVHWLDYRLLRSGVLLLGDLVLLSSQRLGVLSSSR